MGEGRTVLATVVLVLSVIVVVAVVGLFLFMLIFGGTTLR